MICQHAQQTTKLELSLATQLMMMEGTAVATLQPLNPDPAYITVFAVYEYVVAT
jgi:hypothetical protein